MASASKLSRKELLYPPPPLQPQQLLSTKKTSDAINNKKQKPHNSNAMNDILSVSREDLSLYMSSHLTRKELLRRRRHRLRQLSKVYKDYYWALMEDLRFHYRDYYWKCGASPFKEEDERESGGDREFSGFNVEGCGETNNNNNNTCVVGGNGGKLGLGFGESVSELKLGGNRCTFVGCKLKAMALTSFCYLHILSDPQQKLYKACNYIISNAPQGPILCGKPILTSVVPSLCNYHFPKAQKDVKHALKKAGLNVSSSSKLAPKFHLLVAEYVHLIQSKRRAVQKHNSKGVVVKEESTS